MAPSFEKQDVIHGGESTNEDFQEHHTHSQRRRLLFGAAIVVTVQVLKRVAYNDLLQEPRILTDCTLTLQCTEATLVNAQPIFLTLQK